MNEFTPDFSAAETISFEMGPSRPPSEAYSLLIRVTRGCPWHRCEFCSSHRTMKFGIRSVEEIKRDIKTAKEISEKIKESSWRLGYGDRVKEAAASVYGDPPNESFRNVALWLYAGGKTAFLQDADSLIMKTPQLVDVLKFLCETFPDLARITSYSRSKTAAGKTLEELKELHDAGLSRLHVGLESGCDEVLNFVQKGVTAAEHIESGKKVVESGISLCEYIMPGLGGRRWSGEHARQTVRVLNAIDPDFIRLRSLSMREDIPLYNKLRNGEFELQTDDEVIEEIRELVCGLEVTSYLASDHIENLLQDVDGQLPGEKEKMLGVIDRYLALPTEERRNFQLGRRMGYYTGLNDLSNNFQHKKMEQALTDIRNKGEDFNKIIFGLKRRFLV